MTDKVEQEQKEFTIVVKVIRQEGHCGAGHQVGDEVAFDGETVQGKMCIHALYSLLPKVFAMRYGAQFPWLQDPDVATMPVPTPGTRWCSKCSEYATDSLLASPISKFL